MVWLRDENGLQIDRGCSVSLVLDVLDEDGAPFEWSTEQLVFELVRTAEDTAALITSSADTPEDGVAVIDLTPADTSGLKPGTYWYRVRLRDGADVWPVISTAQIDVLP